MNPTTETSWFRALAIDPNAPDAGVDLRYTDTTGLQLFDALSWEATVLVRFVGEGRSESPVHTVAESVAILETIDQAKTQLEAQCAATV